MWEIIRLFYKFNLKYKTAFIAGFILLIFSRVTANFANFFYKFFVDVIATGEMQLLVNILAALIIVKLLTMVLELLVDLINDIYIINSARDARIAVFSHLHKLDYSFHASKRSGSLISAMKRGDSAIFSINIQLNRNLPLIIMDFIFIVINFDFLDMKLLLTVLVIVLLYILLARFLVAKNIKRRKIHNREEDFI